MFDDKSRYAHQAMYTVIDRRGRTITVVATPDAAAESLRGYHALREGERLDHLAHAYLGHGTEYWRICELADVMTPDALAEVQEIAIPHKGRR